MDSQLITSIRLQQALKGFGTLKERRKLKPVSERAFLIPLVTRLEVRVFPAGARTLKLAVSLNDATICNTQEKHFLQSLCANDPKAAKFAQDIETPRDEPYQYEGPVPWRCMSGGYIFKLLIEGVPWVPLFLREMKQIPGWNLPNGASETEPEVKMPHRIAEREAKRALIIQNVYTGTCYRLERPGGSESVAAHHRRVFKLLGLKVDIDSEPTIGHLASGMPDSIWVEADWAPGHGPFVSEPCYLIFNYEGGEDGIECIQLFEVEIKAPLHHLILRDGEIHENGDTGTGKKPGEPIQRPIGLFLYDELRAAIENSLPLPQPAIVYDKGIAYQGARLLRWLKDHPLAEQSCPVTRKVFTRHFAQSRGAGNHWYLKGRRWSVRFEGNSFELKNWVGIRYIAYLVAHPEEEVLCTDLVWLIRGHATANPVYSQMSAAQLAEEGLSLSSSSGGREILNHPAIRSLKKRLEELKQEIDSLAAELSGAQRRNDIAAMYEIQSELERKTDEKQRIEQELLAHISRRTGQSTRFPNAPQDRARDAVSHAIRRALKAIKFKDEKLWLHLKQYLDFGEKCIYSPPPHVKWRT
jgi:hypothetical protein